MSAYRGYRRQALYALHRLLALAEGERLQPEGVEDLSVIAEGRLVEANQVKSLAAPLTLSHLDPTAVVLGVDDEDTAWRHDDVVDVAAGAGHPAIVEDADAFDARERLGELLSPAAPRAQARVDCGSFGNDVQNWPHP